MAEDAKVAPITTGGGQGSQDSIDKSNVDPSELRATGMLVRPPQFPLTEEQQLSPIVIAWEAPWIRNYGLAPYNPDALIASKGYDTLDGMRTIAAYNGPLTILINSSLSKMHDTGFVKPPGHIPPGHPDYDQAAKIASELEWHLLNIEQQTGRQQSFRQVLKQVALAVHTGFSVVETTWRYVEDGPEPVRGQFGFQYFSYKRCKQIGFNLDPISQEVVSINNYANMSGGPQRNIPIRKVILFTFRPYDGHPYGRGVARECYKHVWILETLYKIWQIALEVHGTPWVKANIPWGNTQYAKAIEASIAAVRSGAPLVLPEGVNAEIVAIQSGGLAHFLEAIRFHTDQVRESILGQTLTTGQGTGKGSYALGAVHQETGETVIRDLRTDIADVISGGLFRDWVEYNYGRDALHMTPRLDLGTFEVKDAFMLSEAIAPLVQNGVLYAQEPFLRELMGFPPIRPEDLAALEEEKQYKRMLEKGSSDTTVGENDSTAQPNDQDEAAGSGEGGDSEQ